MHTIVTKINQHDANLIKHYNFLVEQHNINKEIATKLQQLEDNHVINYVEYIKSIGNIGKA